MRRLSHLFVIDSKHEMVNGEDEEKEQTSSRKRAKTFQLQTLEDYADEQKKRLESVISGTERGTDTLHKLAYSFITHLAHQLFVVLTHSSDLGT